MAKNYLMARGELLTKRIPPPPMKPTKSHPYSFDEAKSFLSHRVADTTKRISELPDAACPNNQVVAVFLLHPSYLAKSYFPTTLLRRLSMLPVGSRQREIVPRKSVRKNKEDDDAPKPVELTAELYISGDRNSFAEWAQSLPSWTESGYGANEIIKLEDVTLQDKEDRIKPNGEKAMKKPALWEVVLHADTSDSSDFILNGFREYIESLGIESDIDSNRMYAGGLCFLPLRATEEQIRDIANFSFLRCVRRMPRIRPLRSTGNPNRIVYSLPDRNALDQNLRVAVFDGGLPATPDLSKWVRYFEAPSLGSPVSMYQDHGLAVTSAALFGSLRDGKTAPSPITNIDHHRVLDNSTTLDEDLFDILNRIRNVLETQTYDFVGISIGPDLPIEDDDVHVWTAVLDDIFSDGKMLPFLAVGNTGTADWDSGNARVQSPSDCVNAIAVGASDSNGNDWRRAPYSSIGPGRCPGVVKPDIMKFGGIDSDPFWVIGAGGMGVPELGTSVATPDAMRIGLGVRANLGNEIEQLTLKALLTHCADRNGHDTREVGWGRIPDSVDDIVLCNDDTARIIYQGDLSPGQWLRARIPYLPDIQSGKVKLTATFCYATETDPQDPVHYTKSGLEIKFRPNKEKFVVDPKTRKKSRDPKTMTYFSSKTQYPTESELRRDAHMWETTLHASKSMLWKTLNDPVFDIHYNAREGGHYTSRTKRIRYALVISLHDKKTIDLYNRIRVRYRTILVPLKAVIEIPIR